MGTGQSQPLTAVGKRLFSGCDLNLNRVSSKGLSRCPSMSVGGGSEAHELEL